MIENTVMVFNGPTPRPVSTDTASRLKLKGKSLTSSKTEHKPQLYNLMFIKLVCVTSDVEDKTIQSVVYSLLNRPNSASAWESVSHSTADG